MITRRTKTAPNTQAATHIGWMRWRVFTVMKMVVMIYCKTFPHTFGHAARTPATLSLDDRVVVRLAQFVGGFDVAFVSTVGPPPFLCAPML